jgi:hypothetical protein
MGQSHLAGRVLLRLSRQHESEPSAYPSGVCGYTERRRRGGVVAGNGARLELRPLILRHLALQIAQLVGETASPCRAQGAFLDQMPVSCPSGCSFVRRSSANSIVSDSPIRRRCTPTLFPAILGLHLTLNAFSAGLLAAVTTAGMAQELPRRPEPLRTRFCIGSGNYPVLVQVMRN